MLIGKKNPYKIYWVTTLLMVGLFTRLKGDDTRPVMHHEDSLLCAEYAGFNTWLPDEFIANAERVCSILPNDSASIKIRRTLVELLKQTPDSFVNAAKQMKQLFLNHQISWHRYKTYIKKRVAPKIYHDHILAYSNGGCRSKPAPLWQWKIACTHKFKGKRLLLWSIKHMGGNCRSKGGKW